MHAYQTTKIDFSQYSPRYLTSLVFYANVRKRADAIIFVLYFHQARKENYFF